MLQELRKIKGDYRQLLCDILSCYIDNTAKQAFLETQKSSIIAKSHTGSITFFSTNTTDTINQHIQHLRNPDQHATLTSRRNPTKSNQLCLEYQGSDDRSLLDHHPG